MEHLFKLKRNDKTVGYCKWTVDWGWKYSLIADFKDTFTHFAVAQHKGINAHPFVCKDKNGKDVFVDDKVSFWLIGCPDRATGIIKWQQESHRFVFVEDSSKSEWGFTDKNDIELIEDKEDE